MLKEINAASIAGGRLGFSSLFSLILTMAACAARPLAPVASGSTLPQERSLIAVVAGELARSEDCNFGNGKTGIAVNKYAVSAKGLVSDEWLKAYLEPSMWAQMKDLVGALREANPDDRLVDWNLAENSELKSADLSTLSAQARERLSATVRCFATFLRPAVSSDGRSALVAVHLGPSPHGAVAFYALVQIQDEWRISAHKLFEFM